MKTTQAFLCLSALLLFSFTVHAKNYYVSVSGNDTNDGLTTTTPWKTLTKVNSTTLAAGDVLLFNGGDTFYGSLLIKQNNITVSAYGTGMPHFTGLITLSGWTNTGNGVWQKSATLKNALNIVTINGIAQEVGRYPNSDAINSGYINASSYNVNTTYTAAELSLINWTGAEVVGRKQAYKFERDRIISQSGSTISYSQTIKTINPSNSGTPSPAVPFVPGFGIFIQRDIRTLDKFGEWYYDSSAKVLSVFFGGNNPAAYNVQASSVDTIINITNHTGTTISNLDISGGNMAAIYWNNATGTTVTNCTIENNVKAIFGWYGSNILVNNNTINWSLCSGIDVRESTQQNVVITSNTLKNTAIYKGMIDNLDPADGVGMFVQSNGARVAFNTIDSVGQNGIHFDGNYIAIDSNLVNHYCYNLNDAGGIYTFPSSYRMMSGRQIIGNTIINAFDPVVGTGEQAGTNPIYLDHGSSDVLISGNNIGNTPGAGIGIFLNSPKNVTVRNNTVFAGWGWYTGRQYSDSMFNVTIKNNIIYSISANQKVVQFTHDGLNTTNSTISTGIQNALQKIGSVDSNYYNVQDANGFFWYYASTFGGSWTFAPTKDFLYWQTYTGLDAHSHKSTYSAQTFQYNYSPAAIVYNFPGFSKKDLQGNVYNNSASIPAWGSKILIDNGTVGNILPIVTMGSNQAVTLPAVIANISGSATDPDGTITKYTWSKIAGPASCTIVTPTAASTMLNNLVQGVYKFELTVTDNNGGISMDSLQVIVNPALNQPPVANGGPDLATTLPANSATLSGSGTDVDGTIIKYNWTKIAGPVSCSIVTPTAATTVLSNLVQGTYNFELAVTDNSGITSKDSLELIVYPAPNQAPIVNAGADKFITLPVTTATLAGSGTDADGSIIKYSWTKIAGPASGTIATASAATTVLNNLVQGTYNFELAVTDNSGITSKDSLQLTVYPAPNQAPKANAGADKSITLPVNTVTLTGSGTDADGTINSYSWVKITGPSGGRIASASGSSTSVKNLVMGIYQYALIVKDNSGLYGRDTVQVTVNGSSGKTVSASAGASKTVLLPTTTTTLSGTATADNTTISSYSWAKIEGPSTAIIVDSQSAVTTVKNLSKGNYKYEFTVLDNEGNSAKDTVSLTVQADNAGSNISMSVYPNPVINIATLEINTIASKEITRVSVSVISLTGKIVARQNYEISGNTNRLKLDMSGLIAGVYTVRAAFTNGKTCSAKVIKLSANR